MKFRSLPHSQPLHPLLLFLSLTGLETEESFWTSREGRDHFRCTVELSPGHTQRREKAMSKPTMPYYGAQYDYTHIFTIRECLQMVLSVNANYTRILWDIFQLHIHGLHKVIVFELFVYSSWAP